MIARMALFGASGDLAGRYLLPALGALVETDVLPARFELLGSGREEWDDDAFREFAADRLDRFAAELAPSARDRLLGSLRFRPFDLNDKASMQRALDWGGPAAREEPVAAYLALPPTAFPEAIASLAEADLPAGSRVAVEKPFGESLESARRLNSLLARAVGEAGQEAIFRVDHVLGMETTQNLIELRRGEGMPASLWDSDRIERIELLWEETLALEGRAGYYDRAGALKDVVQNHLMQLLCLVAMESPPVDAHLRDAKVQVLRAVDSSAGAIAQRSRRARYEAGRIGDRAIPAYAAEDGVDPDREIETFAELALELDLPRWRGTNFVLRGAKAVAERRKGVLVRFHSPEAPLGGQGREERWIDIDGSDQVSGRGLPAYAHVLRDLLCGGGTLSVSGEEAEEAWRIVEPVLAAWAAGEVPLLSYPAGSSGP